MSEVNADGVLLNPQEAILQEVQALSNSLMAQEPEGMEDDQAHAVYAGNGQRAGTVGGAPHIPPETAAAAGEHRGAGSGSRPNSRPKNPPAGPGRKPDRQSRRRRHPVRRRRRYAPPRGSRKGAIKTWQTRTHWVW